MADDERRAEIEAAARAVSCKLNSWLYAVGLNTAQRVDIASYEIAEAALDAVRDARGDEEAGRLHAGTGSDRIFMHSTHQRPMAGCRLCEAEAARSPQDEDHER
jgi:hypothetical protein